MLVVSGGMLGVTLARACADAGAGAVLLAEAGTLGSGATGGAVGLCAAEPHHGIDPPVLVDLGRERLARWRELDDRVPGGVGLLDFEWIGTLSEAQCGKRLESLAAKVCHLRERREELVVAVQQASASVPSASVPEAEVFAEMRRNMEHALTSGAVPRVRRSSKRSSTRSASKGATALYRGSACQAARTRRFAPWRVWRGLHVWG